MLLTVKAHCTHHCAKTQMHNRVVSQQGFWEILFGYKDRLDMGQTLSIEKRVVENMINTIKHKIHSWRARIRYRAGGSTNNTKS